jgi:hypothetical protein
MCAPVYDVSVTYFTRTVPRVNQIWQPNEKLYRPYTFEAAVISLFDIQKGISTKADIQKSISTKADIQKSISTKADIQKSISTKAAHFIEIISPYIILEHYIS